MARITRNIGMLLLGIYLILIAVIQLIPRFPSFGGRPGHPGAGGRNLHPASSLTPWTCRVVVGGDRRRAAEDCLISPSLAASHRVLRPLQGADAGAGGPAAVRRGRHLRAEAGRATRGDGAS
jgi:hypothetical protein